MLYRMEVIRNMFIAAMLMCAVMSAGAKTPDWAKECSCPGIDTLPQDQRDSVLKVIAKNVVMTLGPWYYRDYKITIHDSTLTDRLSMRQRPIYVVTYYCDPEKEAFDARYAARVNVWKDTGIAADVTFGNRRGLDLGRGWPMWKGKIYQMPFHSRPPVKGDKK